MWQCSNCQSLQWGKRHTINPKDLYNYEYFHSKEYFNYTDHKAIHYANANQKWKLLQPFLPEKLHMLEVGSAYGYFTHFVREKGFEDAFGFDISEEAVADAKRNFGPYFTNDISHLPLKPYNLITMWDTWEHLADPSDKLASFYDKLPSGGILALTTIDAGSVVARVRKSHWRQIHPPTHVVYPTRIGMRKHLEKHGFSLLEQKSFSPFRALEVYLKALGLQGLCPEKIKHLPVKFNLFDIQFIIAKKR